MLRLLHKACGIAVAGAVLVGCLSSCISRREGCMLSDSECVELEGCLLAIETQNPDIRRAIIAGDYIVVVYRSNGVMYVYKKRSYSDISNIKTNSAPVFIFFAEPTLSQSIRETLTAFEVAGYRIPYVVTSHSYYGYLVERAGEMEF